MVAVGLLLLRIKARTRTVQPCSGDSRLVKLRLGIRRWRSKRLGLVTLAVVTLGVG